VEQKLDKKQLKKQQIKKQQIKKLQKTEMLHVVEAAVADQSGGRFSGRRNGGF
jgi:hypothetical protein